MPTSRRAKSALGHARRWCARGLFRLASSILRFHQSLRRHPILAALSAVRFLERSAALLMFGHRPRDDRKEPGRSHRP